MISLGPVAGLDPCCLWQPCSLVALKWHGLLALVDLAFIKVWALFLL